MKLERRSKIIELIAKYHIETQEELGERLEQEGFTVTQIGRASCRERV